MPFLGQVGDLVPRHDDLEYAPVHFPVAELRGPGRIHAQVDDVQTVPEIVQHQARLTVVGADGPRFPQRVEVVEPHLLAPDAAGGGGEGVLFRRWRRREQRDVTVGGADRGLIRGA